MEKKKLSRREFLRMAGASGGAALLAASGINTAAANGFAAPPVQDTKTITCWLGGSYHPTEWTSRSAEHPMVRNAARILAERFQEDNPGVEISFIDYDVAGESDAYAAWLTARVASGELLTMEQVRQVISEAHGPLRAMLEAMPAGVAQRVNPGEPDHARAVLEDEVARMLRRLSE